MILRCLEKELIQNKACAPLKFYFKGAQKPSKNLNFLLDYQNDV